MSFQAIQNNYIVVNAVQDINDTGWVINGSTACHSCTPGLLTLSAYPVIKGHTYTVTYTIISGAGVQTFVGGTGGTWWASTGIILENITAANNGFVQLYATGSVCVQLFNIKDITVNDAVTTAFDAINKKQVGDRTLYPDFGFSLFEGSVSTYQGNLWSHQNNGSTRNNFFGTQYQSIVEVVGNQHPEMVKRFKSLSYQSNQLWITSTNGITTSLGQVSDLIQQDFLKATLTAGSGTVSIYNNYGVYSAPFWNDKNVDLVNGDPLRGNWVKIALVTFDGSVPVQLFTVAINDKRTPIGVR